MNYQPPESPKTNARSAKNFGPSTLFVVHLLCILGVFCGASCHAAPERKVFAHYMACYPVASGATAWHHQEEAHTVRHDGKGQSDWFGDRWRNWPLVPEKTQLDLEASLDLEIRRALRAGLDGFAIDMWAGGKEHCQKVIDTFFQIAEAKNYPFEITLCYDENDPQGVKWLLDKHGKSAKLGRYGGKPLIFGYYSALKAAERAAREDSSSTSEEDWKTKGELLMNSPQLRATPEGWQRLIKAQRSIETEVGQPIFWHFCLEGYFLRVTGQDERELKRTMLAPAAKMWAQNGFAIGSFLGYEQENEVFQAVKSVKGEWAQPLWFQYENGMHGMIRFPHGTQEMRDNWRLARERDSHVLQFVTWNDYTENTMLAPAYATHYTILDLNAFFAQWWKSGREPKPDHDRVYVSYQRYANDAKIFPFKARIQRPEGSLEVLTILPKEAIVRLPGRGVEYRAPRGVFAKQLPLQAGPVTVKVSRGGKIETRLDSPEPITDKPFREQAGIVSFSTEDARQWQLDFPFKPYFAANEYGDTDGDGLPNWFEMYWFGKFLDWSTATGADPNADPDGDGQTNLQEYQAQTDPTKKPE